MRIAHIQGQEIWCSVGVFFVEKFWELYFSFAHFMANAANRPEEDGEPVFFGNEISCEELITRYFRQGLVYVWISSALLLLCKPRD